MTSGKGRHVFWLLTVVKLVSVRPFVSVGTGSFTSLGTVGPVPKTRVVLCQGWVHRQPTLMCVCVCVYEGRFNPPFVFRS